MRSCPSRNRSAQTVDLLADHPLDRIAAGIDFRPHILDHDASVGPPFRAMPGSRPMRRRARSALAAPGAARARSTRTSSGASAEPRRRRPARRRRAASRRAPASRRDTRPAARQQPLEHDLARLALLRVDQNQGALGAALALPQQREQRVVGRLRRRCGPSSLSAGTAAFMPVDRGDVTRCRSKRGGSGSSVVAVRHHRDAPRPAVLEAHRHHHAGRERGGEGIGLAVARLDLALRKPGRQQLGDQPLGVVAFRKGDRRRDMAVFLVLVEQPRALEIPPFEAVEQIVEAGIGERQHLLLARPEVLGAEHDIRDRRALAASISRRHASAGTL